MSWDEYKHAIVYVHISGTCLTFSTVCVLRRRKNETKKSFLTIPSMDFSIGFPLRPGRVVVFFLSLPKSGKCSILQTGKFFCSGEWKKNALGNGKLVPVTRMFFSSLNNGKFHRHPRNPVIFLTVQGLEYLELGSVDQRLVFLEQESVE